MAHTQEMLKHIIELRRDKIKYVDYSHMSCSMYRPVYIKVTPRIALLLRTTATYHYASVNIIFIMYCFTAHGHSRWYCTMIQYKHNTQHVCNSDVWTNIGYISSSQIQFESKLLVDRGASDVTELLQEPIRCPAGIHHVTYISIQLYAFFDAIYEM